MAVVIVNNFRNFLSIQYDKLDREGLFSNLRESYSLKDELLSKDAFIEECKKLNLTDSIANLKKHRNNPNHSDVIYNILDIWKVIDMKKIGPTISTFVAADTN